MIFNAAKNVFEDRTDGSAILASSLIASEDTLNAAFPTFELSPAYWDISFKYFYVNQSAALIDIKIILSYKKNSIEITPPKFLHSDYFIVDEKILPIRSYDFDALNAFLPTLDHDEIPGFTVKELMNFDYFVSKNNLQIANPELKDKVLASANLNLSQFENRLDVTPYPYQSVGIEWLRSQQSLGRKGVILADVMGLGKTLQAIALITENVDRGLLNNLVICPGTLIENWRREISKFSSGLNYLTHSGSLRAGTAAKITNFDVVITSYDALVRDHAMLSSISWNLVIVDEAQFIKNPSAQRSMRCKGLPRSFGIAISGTPLENRLLDLWSLTEFAEPGLFGTESQFENEFESDPQGATEVNRIIRPILLRRKLDDIEHQLPEMVVIDHPIIWPEELNNIYEEVRNEAIREFAHAGGLVATGRLRKLTTHPLLMEIGPSDMTVLSPKYALALEIIDELFANGEKCLIFASYN